MALPFQVFLLHLHNPMVSATSHQMPEVAASPRLLSFTNFDCKQRNQSVCWLSFTSLRDLENTSVQTLHLHTEREHQAQITTNNWKATAERSKGKVCSLTPGARFAKEGTDGSAARGGCRTPRSEDAAAQRPSIAAVPGGSAAPHLLDGGLSAAPQPHQKDPRLRVRPARAAPGPSRTASWPSGPRAAFQLSLFLLLPVAEVFRERVGRPEAAPHQRRLLRRARRARTAELQRHVGPARPSACAAEPRPSRSLLVGSEKNDADWLKESARCGAPVRRCWSRDGTGARERRGRCCGAGSGGCGTAGRYGGTDRRTRADRPARRSLVSLSAAVGNGLELREMVLN